MEASTQERLLQMQQDCKTAVSELRALQIEQACDETQNLLDHWQNAHQAVSSLLDIHAAQPERDLRALTHCIHQYMLVHAHSFLSSQARYIADIHLMARP